MSLVTVGKGSEGIPQKVPHSSVPDTLHEMAVGAEEVEGGRPWGLRDCGAAGTQEVGKWEARGHKAGRMVGPDQRALNASPSKGRFAWIFSCQKVWGMDRRVESAGGRWGRWCRQRAVLE